MIGKADSHYSSEKTSTSHCIWLVCFILLVGAALRIAPLTDNRLHPDEALFSTLGRLIIEGKDPWLSDTWLLVDKPPLFYYTLAGGLSIAWDSELAARLPGLFASILSIALGARLARRLWRAEIAVLGASTFIALSPFAIAFSPTVFADPIMVMWLLAAMNAVCAGRWGWGGVLYGCALATKQNALFAAPLVVTLGIGQMARNDTVLKQWLAWAGRFLFGSGLIVVLIIGWELIRHGRHDFWSAGVEANNPGRFIRSNEVWPRAAGWWHWASYIAGSQVGMVVAGIGFVVLAVHDGLHRHRRRAVASLLLLSYITGYAGLLWLVAFPMLDRYLLLVAPIVGLLVGRGMDQAVRYFAGDRYGLAGTVAIIGLAAVLGWPAMRAALNDIPVGGDHGAYDGIDVAADFLGRQPVGTVVYYDTLGWSLAYYLFDDYVFPAPFASPDALTADLEAFGNGADARYLILPAWRSQIEALEAVEAAGFAAEPILETYNREGEPSLMVYHITRP